MICDKCLHADVCGAEGVYEEALTYCSDFLGWIPVSERLPEEREWYLAVFKEKDTDYQLIPRVADYIGNGKWQIIDEDGLGQDYRDILECVAWMPLPEPYKASPTGTESEDIEALEHPEKNVIRIVSCGDSISRQAVLTMAYDMSEIDGEHFTEPCMVVDVEDIQKLPPVNPQPKTGHCKECKYFEYDSVAKVDGIPLIVAHEICKKWGDGCKTSEDGYCFLFESQESEDKE